MKRMLLGVCCITVVGLMVGYLGGGCGGQASAAGSNPATDQTATTEAAQASNVTEPEGLLPIGFDEVVAGMAPLPAFVLLELPSGVTLADSWWPVTEPGSQPDTSSSEVNPRITGEGSAEPEAQLLLSYGDGWLMVIENFRGDLGDVAGEPVGSVEGSPASLYEVNGGWLVQWGYDGRWYGVFGRGVPKDTLTSIALAMTLM